MIEPMLLLKQENNDIKYRNTLSFKSSIMMIAGFILLVQLEFNIFFNMSKRGADIELRDTRLGIPVIEADRPRTSTAIAR